MGSTLRKTRGAAGRRELHEETGVRSASVLGVYTDWLTYEFPPYDGPPHRLDRFRGQRQLWHAMRFEGEDAEIEVALSPEGAGAEFSDWRWERLDATIDRRAVQARRLRRGRARFLEVRDACGTAGQSQSFSYMITDRYVIGFFTNRSGPCGAPESNSSESPGFR